MLRVQIRVFISPELTLKPTFQGHPFPDLAHSDKWRVVAKRQRLVSILYGKSFQVYYSTGFWRSMHNVYWRTCVMGNFWPNFWFLCQI